MAREDRRQRRRDARSARPLALHDVSRLALLRQFLREDGLICVNLDDTEAGFCRLLLDETFGGANCLAIVAWEKRYTRSNNARMFYSVKDTLPVYRKTDAVNFLREARTEKSNSFIRILMETGGAFGRVHLM
jgi:adenine specific DNA methylase Mod